MTTRMVDPQEEQAVKLAVFPIVVAAVLGGLIVFFLMHVRANSAPERFEFQTVAGGMAVARLDKLSGEIVFVSIDGQTKTPLPGREQKP